MSMTGKIFTLGLCLCWGAGALCLAPVSGVRNDPKQPLSALYSEKTRGLLSRIRKTLERRGPLETLLYIGSAGDISTALAVSDCDTFLFVDALPYSVFDDFEESDLVQLREVYLDDKKRGWSKSEVLDFLVRSAEYPVRWELALLGAFIERERFDASEGAHEIVFTLPGDGRERKILYYTIEDAYDSRNYPESLKARIDRGIDLFLVKSFQPRELPREIADRIIRALSPAGTIVCDTYFEPFLDGFSSLEKHVDPGVRRYERMHGVSLGYEGHSVLFYSRRAGAFLFFKDGVHRSA
jgi:hypothetical protein